MIGITVFFTVMIVHEIISLYTIFNINDTWRHFLYSDIMNLNF